MTARRRCGSPRRWRPIWCCSTSPCPAWTGSTSPARCPHPTVDPAVVFVTAFDNFAVAAFDVAAIDYLMKPVEPDRLERALERVREHLAGGGARAARPAAAAMSRNSGCPIIAAWSASPPRTSTGSPPSATICGSMSAPARWLIHRTIAKLEEDLDPGAVHPRPPLGDPAPRHDHRPLPRRGRPLDRAPRRRRRAAHRPLLCRRGEEVRGKIGKRRRWGTAASTWPCRLVGSIGGAARSLDMRPISADVGAVRPSAASVRPGRG